MSDARIYDVEAGLIKMAMLADANSEVYKNSIERGSENNYKSRHFREMNKTMATFKKAAEMREQSEYSRGWAESYRKYAINFPCSVCGELLAIEPNSEMHRVILGYLREKGWAHTECFKRPG